MSARVGQYDKTTTPSSSVATTTTRTDSDGGPGRVAGPLFAESTDDIACSFRPRDGPRGSGKSLRDCKFLKKPEDSRVLYIGNNLTPTDSLPGQQSDRGPGN